MLDLPARIKALAGIERPCAHDTLSATQLKDCLKCGGTGSIALFKALRLPCLLVSGDPCWGMGYTDRRYGPESFTYKPCPACQGRNWVPEPDVEKACWRLWRWYQEYLDVSDDSREQFKRVVDAFFDAPSAEEAVISTAEAWAKEAQRAKA